MHFTELVTQLGVHLRLPDLAPDANGNCAVRLDEGVYSFYPEADGQSFTVRTRLGQIDPQDEDALRRILGGNLFEDGVGGSALGVDARGVVYLTQHMTLAGLSFPRFVEIFGRFVGTAEHWTAQMQGLTPAEEPS
jgi:hypothetical protein